jgi:hypothetical protein
MSKENAKVYVHGSQDGKLLLICMACADTFKGNLDVIKAGTTAQQHLDQCEKAKA